MPGWKTVEDPTPTTGGWKTVEEPSEDDAPKGKAIAWDSKSSDDDIIKALGYDPAVLKKSKFYTNGTFSRLTTDPGSPVSKATSGPLFSAIKGATGVGLGLAQLMGRGWNITGALSDADVQMIDAAKKFTDLEYERSHTQLGNEKATGLAKGALNASEFVGEAVPGLAFGGPSLSGAKLLSSQGAKQLGKIAAVGAGTAMAQPVTVDPNDPNSYLNAKLKQGMGGLVMAPAATLALEKVATPIGKAIFNKAKTFGNAPSTTELAEDLSARLGGKSPGRALQDAADTKYDAAWGEFKKAMSPVDEEAASVGMNYRTAINELEGLLGKNGKRSPMAMPDERKKVLENLLSDLQEAGDPKGNVSNSFADAIDVVKRLGAEQRRLAVAHGDTEARETLGKVRDSILKSMEESNSSLSQKAKEARTVFRTQVAPLFDKSEGGQYLTQIRDTPTPGDLLASGNQGSLARMKPDRAAIVAKGSSADPLLYSYLDAAITQANGKPGSFATSLEKAMPAIEQIADEKTLEAFRGVLAVSKGAKYGGTALNLGAASMIPGHAAGGAAAVLASFNPAYSGPGLTWKLMQNPTSRLILRQIGKTPTGSPEFTKLMASLSSVMAGREFNRKDDPNQEQK